MTIELLLQSRRGTHVDLLHNVGNAGDALIRAGTSTLLRRLEISAHEFSYPEQRTGDFLLISGAGTLCRAWFHNIERVRFYAPRYKTACVMPASVEPDFPPVQDFLRSLPRNVIFFCRERTSYEAVRTLAPISENVHLDHDMAFLLDASPWKRDGRGAINVFRTDAESPSYATPRPNFDISSMGNEYQETLLFDILSNFEQVFTNRLHVGIAGALLGRSTVLFANNYHKVHAVFEFSLKSFPNVRLGTKSEFEAMLSQSRRERAKALIRSMISGLPAGAAIRRVITNAKARRTRRGCNRLR